MKDWLTQNFEIFLNVTHFCEMLSSGLHLPDRFQFAHGPWDADVLHEFSCTWTSYL